MSRSNSIKNGLDIVSGIALIVASGVLVWKLVFVPSSQTTAPQPIETVKGVSIAPDKIRNSRGTSPIALVEFADYECPFCAQHASTTAVAIEEQLVSKGLLREIYFHLPLPIHPNAKHASEAAECAREQGKYWPMHSRLFTHSTDLSAPTLTADASALGINIQEFNDCVAGDKHLASIQSDIDEAKRLGIRATPTFFVGRVKSDGTIELKKRLNGAVPIDAFMEAFRDVAGRDVAAR